MITPVENVPTSYTGESDHWKLSYGRDENLTLQYSGDDPIQADKIHYSINHKNRLDSGNMPIMDNAVFILRTELEYNPSDVEITIEWGEQTENITLENAN